MSYLSISLIPMCNKVSCGLIICDEFKILFAFFKFPHGITIGVTSLVFPWVKSYLKLINVLFESILSQMFPFLLFIVATLVGDVMWYTM